MARITDTVRIRHTDAICCVMDTISRQTAEHYRWGRQCDGWHLVRSDSLSVIEECMPSGASEVAHHHVTARQFFYVLFGQLDMHLGDSVRSIRAGEGLEISPGIIHRAHNTSEYEVRFLVCSVPPTKGDRINSA